MAYTNAVFYLDFSKPVTADAARTTLSGVVFDNSAGTTVRGTKVGHGLVTGAVITVSGCTQAYANSAWKITWVDADTFTLDGALWASFTGADVTGDVVPFGGQSWDDAWSTMTNGATAARIAPGDTIKIAKSPVPYSLGHANWPSGILTTYLKVVGISSSVNSSPIAINATAHGVVTGDMVLIYNHSTNTNANGWWKATRVTANQFTLDDSVGNGTGSGGTYYNITGKVVTLATSGLTKTVDDCDRYLTWTAANSGIIANGEYYNCREGASSVKLTLPSSPAINTKYAYKTLTSADYSGYQTLSFWFYSPAVVLADRWKVCLCSDTAGADIVDTFEIPALPSASRWVPLTIARTGGSNLGNPIQSIALYSAGTAPAASASVNIDGIIACTAGGLNLQTLISKEHATQGGTHGWYPIQAIKDTFVAIGTSSCLPSAGRPFDELTAQTDVDTYARETTKVQAQEITNLTGVINDSGTAGNLITFESGYNTSDGSLDGETFLDWINWCGGFYANSKNYIRLNYLNAVRTSKGIEAYSACTYFSIGRFGSFGAASWGVMFGGGVGWTIDDLIVMYPSDEGVYVSQGLGAHFTKITKANGSLNKAGFQLYISKDVIVDEFVSVNANGGAAIEITGYSPQWSDRAEITLVRECCLNTGGGLTIINCRNCHVGTITKMTNNNGTYGVQFSTVIFGAVDEIADISNNGFTSGAIQFYNSRECWVNKVTSCVDNLGAAAVYASGSNDCGVNSIVTSGNYYIARIYYASGSIYLNNATCSEVEAKMSSLYAITDMAKIHYTNFNGSSDDHRTYEYAGSIRTDSTTRHTASGVSWKFAWDSGGAVRDTLFPLRLPVQFAFEANKLVTFKAYVRRSANTVGIRLRIRGSSIPGIGYADLITTATAASVDAWEELTLTFTPTIKGAIEAYVEAFYISAYAPTCWVDDMTITQEA